MNGPISRLTAEAVGSAVRQRRRERSLTQQQLADMSMTTRQWINRLERGDRRVSLEKVIVVLEQLGLELSAKIGTSPQDVSIGQRGDHASDPDLVASPD